jgi:nucleoside-diphosphate-sugar epimerase
MRALVTGASGFVGSALCKALLQAGHEVVGLSRDPQRAAGRVGSDVKMVHGGVGDPQQIARAAEGCELLFHAAGLPPGPAPQRVLRWLHVAGSENVLRAARHARVQRVVHISCADVSLTAEDRMHWDEKRVLTSPAVGAFAQSKLMAEELMLAESNEQLEVVALRPARVWGPGDVDGIARLSRDVRSGSFRLYGGGRNIVATTHIDNLCKAALLAASAERAPSHAYYVTDGEFLDAHELYGKLLGALGLPLPALNGNFTLAWLSATLKARLGDGGATQAELLRNAHSALFDVSAAVHDLGYEPKLELEPKLEELRSWLASQGGLEALITRARPAPVAADVDEQVRAAGGD